MNSGFFRSLALMGAVLGVLSAEPAAALSSSTSEQKTTTSGQQLKVGEVFVVAPDCAPNGTPVIKLTKQPLHGTFYDRPAMVFPNYPKSNPRAHCDSKRVAGRQQTYVSEPGYTGRDSLDFIVVYPNGDTLHVYVSITVI